MLLKHEPPVSYTHVHRYASIVTGFDQSGIDRGQSVDDTSGMGPETTVSRGVSDFYDEGLEDQGFLVHTRYFVVGRFVRSIACVDLIVPWVCFELPVVSVRPGYAVVGVFCVC
ncbi:hypothetical protein SARC_17130 [Sphaeroforma arctica JP610]|uniref:Uncharacterized protein n=1 Tax=Sphaeroforma arctica JP610 TaxID=667725 RepID=A0A0L0F113_9EUKA|nr:hypothetical protein SARC_17130 [Sphaeroforma arctica JP610]KNC70346.1 hypothetical protein SARC_17130 [Sphaeroforma arctica JP610]|eukprot:XP_014144248.1 hypothetical protein SARC_17130 [Sphaeroforma arctica JP610]